MPSPTPSPQPAVSPDDDRERLAQLFEQAPSLMAMLREPEHRIVLANRAFLRVAGDPDAVGKRVAEVLPPALADEAVKALDLAWSGGGAVRKGDVRWPVANASAPGGVEERILDLVLQPVHAPVDGAVMGVFVEGTDVTKRVRAEARLKVGFAIQTVGIVDSGRLGARDPVGRDPLPAGRGPGTAAAPKPSFTPRL